jgi:hypothetical protein
LAAKPVPAEAYLPTEPVQMEVCPAVSTAGVNYQELSILTGGLRFPICQFDHYDTVFQTIAEDVVVQADIACFFPIPDPPPGQDAIVLDNVAVTWETGTGTSQTFGQAATVADCQADAFYIDAANDQINLCPEACDAVRADATSNVRVDFTCESTIIVK